MAKETSALVDRAIVIGSGLQNDVTEVDFFAGHQSLTTMTAYQREKSTLEYLEQGCVGIHERSGIHYFLKHAALRRQIDMHSSRKDYHTTTLLKLHRR